jgi:hypothetical protein
VNEAKQWIMSQQIRDYVTHIETQLRAGGNEIPDAAQEWVAASKKRAEQLDPTETRLNSFR